MKFKRYIPVIVILVLIGLFWALGWDKYFSYAVFNKNRQAILAFVSNRPFISALIGISIYTVITVLVLPVGVLLTLIMGYLFPQPYCTLIVAIGATIGASVIYFSARTALKKYFEQKTKGLLNKIGEGFRKNGAFYLFFLRIVPISPFWIVNVAAARFNVRYWTFLWTTFLGILPVRAVISQAGRGLNKIFESGKPVTLFSFFSVEMVLGLSGIMILAIILLIIKNYRERGS